MVLADGLVENSLLFQQKEEDNELRVIQGGRRNNPEDTLLTDDQSTWK